MGVMGVVVEWMKEAAKEVAAKEEVVVAREVEGEVEQGKFGVQSKHTQRAVGHSQNCLRPVGSQCLGSTPGHSFHLAHNEWMEGGSMGKSIVIRSGI